MAKASGVVTLNGIPFAGARVMFVPKKGPAAMGVADKDGRYILTTFEENDGAVPGQYRVSITAQAAPTPEKAGSPQATVPAKYGDPEKSELTCEIAPGVNVMDFELAN
jgi:hypothetical protein